MSEMSFNSVTKSKALVLENQPFVFKPEQTVTLIILFRVAFSETSKQPKGMTLQLDSASVKITKGATTKIRLLA